MTAKQPLTPQGIVEQPHRLAVPSLRISSLATSIYVSNLIHFGAACYQSANPGLQWSPIFEGEANCLSCQIGPFALLFLSGGTLEERHAQ